MQFYNTLTGQNQEFKPLNNKRVTLYVCGITPYDTTHLGHAFTYIFFDTLLRYLKFKGYKVTYTQNVTDINDRDNDILKRAAEEKTTWSELSNFWTKKFLKDMEKLNWIKPTNYLFASKEIPSMIDLIKKIISNGLGYEKNGGVYLDVAKISDFGKLSKLKYDEMIEKAKDFEEDLNNRDKLYPLDITLWRGAKPNQTKNIPSFDSPWGPGRPGWHIECSAMSISTLGQQIDIHGGGRDLIFPHHESEIVESESATGKIPFAKYWLHTGTVMYEGQKMSKSKGNLVLVSDLLKKYSANAIRWVLLSHRWNEDWEFHETELERAEEKIEKIKRISTIHSTSVAQSSNEVVNQFSSFLDENMNTPSALNYILKTSGKTQKDYKIILSILGFY